MNDTEPQQRARTRHDSHAAALHIVGDHPHPVRPRDRDAHGSGPALARAFRTRLRVSDLSIVIAVAAAAGVVSIGQSRVGPAFATAPGQTAIVGLVVLVWIALLRIFRTRDSRVLCVGVTEYKRVVSASVMTFGFLAIAFVIVQIQDARFYFLLAFPIGIVGLLLDRWLWRKWLVRRSRAGSYLSKVVVVGTRNEVAYVIRQVAQKSGAAYSIVGAIVEGGPGSNRTLSAAAFPISQDVGSVPAIASALGADSVIVAGVPSNHSDYVRDLAWDLEGTATELIIATNLANVAGPRIHLRPVEGLPLIHVEIPQFEGGRHALKRAFDVAVAGCALIVLAPLFAVLAIMIRLDSPGPAFFRQERVGRDGRSFTMLKFRSMRERADEQLGELIARNEGSGLLFKLHDDPRVTRIGRFIRRHSLDEFPQLWNILLGDMSLVGPRPPLPREVEGYEDRVHRRLYIRPGLTGMWQVNGRSTLGWEESVKLDLYYVENWSLVGDIVIMWRTLREVSHPIGAF